MRRFDSHTADVVARDRALSGLSMLLDTAQLCEQLNAAMSEVEIESAELTYLRYKPGTNCVAQYRLRTDQGMAEIYAKAYGPDAAVKLGKDQRRPVERGPLGLGRWPFWKKNVVVSTFPNDAKLPSLSRLSNPASRDRLFKEMMTLPGGDDEPLGATLAPLAYKPERRFVAKSTWPGDAGTVIKFVTTAEYDRVLGTARQLTGPAFKLTPRLIGKSRKRRALAFRWLPGRGLREVTAAPAGAFHHIEAAGSALAAFHDRAARLHARPCRDVELRLQALTGQIAFLLPALAKPMAGLAGRVAAWWRGCDEHAGVVHGDFYDKQVIVSGEGVHILDIDSVEAGHPVRDLGLFIAHLERDAISDNIDAANVVPFGEALIRGYLASGGHVDLELLRGYTALGLLQLVHHPFRKYEPEWPEKIERLLARADQLLCHARTPIDRSWSTASCK